MATFASMLQRKEEVATGIMAFYFEKPEGFEYTPGQHATVRIVNPPETDEEGNDRTFSMVTTPNNPELGFTTRMRDSAFKRTLKNAEPGLEVEILDPRGSMILPANTSRTLVFLAGGIGITPFISMVRQAAEEKSAQKIILFYSNKTKEGAAFFDELQELSQQNPNFTFVPTLTQEDPTKWQGETGHIDEAMMKKYITTLDNTVFYMAGPAGLVTGLMSTLGNAGVDSLFIKSEDFGEYK